MKIIVLGAGKVGKTLIKHMSNEDHDTIARVRNPDYSSQRDFMRNQLGFSMIVNPELEAASEIRRVLSFPSAVKVDTFSRGKVELAEFFVEDHSRLNGVELSQLHKITKTNILVCAVSHNEDVIIPDGNYVIKPGDHLYITGTHRDLSRFCLDIGVITTRIKNVIIVGGGKIAYYLSKQLSTQGIKVKIIEKDKNRCQVLAEKLPYVTIIHGDGSDDELLNEEGIENTDAVLALTGLDEENIVLSLSAKSLYHKKTIAKVTRMNYAGLSDVLKVDSIVAPKKIVASQIIRYVRAKMNKDNDSSVKTLYKIVDGEVEAIEFKVTEQFKYLHKTLNEMKIKEHVLVAAIIRENEVIVPKGNTTMELNDYVIIVSRGEIMKSLNDILRG